MRDTPDVEALSRQYGPMVLRRCRRLLGDEDEALDAYTKTLADGAMARPGDLLRLGYSAVDRPFGAILSIDGRGTVTLHLPANGPTAAPLGRGDKTLLDTPSSWTTRRGGSVSTS